jgi:hypothetical protein
VAGSKDSHCYALSVPLCEAESCAFPWWQMERGLDFSTFTSAGPWAVSSLPPWAPGGHPKEQAELRWIGLGC